MPISKILSEGRVPVKIWTDDVEEEAQQQLQNIAKLPFIYKHVAAMPDVHFGLGATVGSVIATKGAIIPAAVGVDIGCGMAAVKLPFSVDRLGDIAKLRHSIERSVPVGHHSHKELDGRRGEAWLALGDSHGIEKLKGPPGEQTKLYRTAMHQLGTLGGGNHFIEICRDKQDGAWIMLHSGSRGIGNTLAKRHIEKAKDTMKRYFLDGEKGFNVLPDPDLAFFVQGTEQFKDYLADLLWCQNYAKANRVEMLHLVMREVWRQVFGPEAVYDLSTLFVVNCHHNYTSQESHFGHNVWLTRKGAVSARDGEFGIIPGSMGAKSFIVKGKGNVESFCSCSHGAGRRMSRTKAKQAFTIADLEAQTAGVECRKDADVLDEIPGAYKDIDKVMADQSDLVDVVFELKQVMCIKG